MNRRQWIKTAGLAAPLILTSQKSADEPVIIGHGEFQYRLNKEWSQADHSKVPVKNCHEMIQAADGRLFLLTDVKKNNVLVYEKSGKLVDSWTLGMGGAHGLTYDNRGGEESLWVTDTRGKIVKTDLEGNQLQELSLTGKKSPTAPTETCVGLDGSIYVIDGYGTQYIYKYKADGTYVKRFGGKSTQPVNKGKFIQAHGIALDTRGVEPLLVCTARIRNEFCWFNLEGNHVKTVYLPGAFMSRPVIKGDELYSGICFGFKKNDYRMWQGQGFVMIMDKDDQVISCPGAAAPEYKEGRLQAMMKQGDAFNNVHDVCVDDEGDLYACQWNSGRVPPYKLERI